MNFQSYESCSRPTSRVLRPPGGGASNIFGTSDQPVQENTKSQEKEKTRDIAPSIQEVKPVVTDANLRRDPITGDVIRNEKKEVANKENNKNEVVEDPLKQYEPHLGPQKSFSGLKCAQPPGGKSNIMFG